MGSVRSVGRKWGRWGVFVAMAMAALLAAPAVAQAEGSSVPDCPAPSWIKSVQSDANGVVNHGNEANSQNPGGTIVIHISDPAHRYVSHLGDVQPGSRATFEYFDQNGLSLASHTTQPARSNGVIHQEPEVRQVNFGPGTHLTVYGTFTDECGRGDVTMFLGYLDVVA
jgi:hypothetical protein